MACDQTPASDSPQVSHDNRCLSAAGLTRPEWARHDRNQPAVSRFRALQETQSGERYRREGVVEHAARHLLRLLLHPQLLLGGQAGQRLQRQRRQGVQRQGLVRLGCGAAQRLPDLGTRQMERLSGPLPMRPLKLDTEMTGF